MELVVDRVACFSDLLADREEDVGAALGEAQAREAVGLRGGWSGQRRAGGRRGESAHVDFLERIPNVKKRSGSLFEADDRGETEEIDADKERFVGHVSRGAENGRGSLCDALQGGR